MLQDVRNNISSQINKSYSINPILTFDNKYGNDKFISPDDFVTAVIKSLQ